MLIYISIKTELSLNKTASLLSNLLDVDFVEDNKNTYDEYPAYIGKNNIFKYALLGPPSPESDIREVKNDEFQLMLYKLSDNLFVDESEFSSKVIKIVNSSDELYCTIS